MNVNPPTNLKRIAKVFYNEKLAGRLTETDDGFEFVYARDYLAEGPPIAFAFPLQKPPFRYEHLPAFFENLAAEGWLRRLQSKEQKIDENDRFGLLLTNGRDLVGAVTIRPTRE